MERVVIQELDACLDRIANASFRTATTYDVVKRVLKNKFITNAHRRLAERGDSATQSQIAFFTGIDPETITNTLSSLQVPSLPLFTIGERIIKRWTNDPDFMNRKTGKPYTLPMYGKGRTFQKLVGRVARGVTPRTAADWLIANKAMKFSGEHWVELLNPKWKPTLTKTQVEHFHRILHEELPSGTE